MKIRRNRSKLKSPQPGFAGSSGPWMVWAGWAVVMWAALAYFNFNIAYKLDMDGPKIPFAVIQNTLLCGLALLVLGFRQMPDAKLPDVGRRLSWCLLVLFLVTAGFLVFYSGDAPMGPFWDDWGQDVYDARNVLDHHDRRLIFNEGGREAFHIYLMALIWWLLPSLKALTVMRIAAGVVVLTTVWVSYLAGKEMGSRRLGLMLAALAAANKPLLHHALAGMRIDTQVLACAFALLMFLRTARRPDMKHFMQSGLALGLGVYTYTGFRSWVLLLPFFFLLWAFTRQGELRAGWKAFVLPGLVLWLHVHYFIGRHLDKPVPLYSPVADLWKSQAWLRWLFFLALLFVLAKTLKALRMKKAGPYTTGWSLGVLVMLASLYPITLDPGFAQELSNSSIFASPYYQAAKVQFVTAKFVAMFKALFVHCDDRHDLFLSFEPYMDFYTMAAVILGLALLAGQPSRRGGFLFLLALAGTVPYMLTTDIANTKFFGIFIPLFALGALAADRLLAASAALSPRPLMKTLALGVLFLLFGAGVWIQFQKFHVLWINEHNSGVLMSRQMKEFTARGGRVYLATPEMMWGGISQSVANDGYVYFRFLRTNAIDLNDGEAPPPVAILANCHAEKDVKELRENFPHANFVPVPRPSRVAVRYEPCHLYRVELSDQDLTEDPTKLIYIRRTHGKPWVRRYCNSFFGIYGRGNTLYEDRAATVGDAPGPINLYDDFFHEHRNMSVMRVIGKLKAETDGQYRFLVKPEQRTWIRVDGRQVCNLAARPGSSRIHEAPVRLKAGEHAVEVGVYNRNPLVAPSVTLMRPGSTTPEIF